MTAPIVLTADSRLIAGYRPPVSDAGRISGRAGDWLIVWDVGMGRQIPGWASSPGSVGGPAERVAVRNGRALFGPGRERPCRVS
jgi:hypothetical protein